MKYIAILLFFVSVSLTAQEVNDPKATQIIEDLKVSYSQFKDFSTSFELDIEIPESDNEKHNGSLIEKGDKFNLTFDKSRIICDGSSIWNYLAEDNEIQINDYEESESDLFLTPKALIKKIEAGDLEYILVDDRAGVQSLEFKPVDKKEEYFKIKVKVTKGLVSDISLFYKNGVRYYITLKDMKTNQGLKDDKFVLVSSEFPGASIEDLRL